MPSPSVLLFSGLPLDVRESDLAELLCANPTHLQPNSVRITPLYNAIGTFLGTFLIEVDNDADAERVRGQFSGQVIDQVHKLQVHHVLPATMEHPSLAKPPAPRSLLPFSGPSGHGHGSHGSHGPQGSHGPVSHGSHSHGLHGARQPAAQPKRQQQKKVAPLKTQQKQPQPQPQKEDTRPEGLKLLGRMGRPGKSGEKEKQTQPGNQRASLKKKSAGDALLMRLKPPKGSPQSKAGAARKSVAARGAAKGKGADKVTRAKKSQAMDVDKPKSKPKPVKKEEPKPKEQPKTQSQLDEEMRAYERARRFGA